MPSKGTHKFSALDYIALGISFFLALLAWFVHNMSQTYSAVARYSVVAESSIDAHSDISSNSAQIAARCELTGYELLYARFTSFSHNRVKVFFSPEYFHHRTGNIYYLDQAGLTRYFHDIFGDEAKLEYFITDTVFFEFPKMDFKKVPVHAVTDLVFSPQYMPTSALKILPDSLLVYGNVDQLKGINRLNTKMIQLWDIDSDCYGEVSLEKIPSVRISASKVGYSINVVRYVELSRTVPVRMKGAPVWTEVNILPSTAKLTIRIPFPMSDHVPDDISVEVNWSDFSASRSGCCIGEVSSVPDGVLQTKIEPEVFSCFVN